MRLRAGHSRPARPHITQLHAPVPTSAVPSWSSRAWVRPTTFARVIRNVDTFKQAVQYQTCPNQLIFLIFLVPPAWRPWRHVKIPYSGRTDFRIRTGLIPFDAPKCRNDDGMCHVAPRVTWHVPRAAAWTLTKTGAGVKFLKGSSQRPQNCRVSAP